MKKHTIYLTIEFHGEKNIGFIKAEHLNSVKKPKSLNLDIVNKVEPALVQALQEHFDCPVSVINHELVETSPFEIIYHVIVKSDEHDHQEKVYLNETWLYSK